MCTLYADHSAPSNTRVSQGCPGYPVPVAIVQQSLLLTVLYVRCIWCVVQGHGRQREVPGCLGRAAEPDGMLTAAAGCVPCGTPGPAQPRCAVAGMCCSVVVLLCSAVHEEQQWRQQQPFASAVEAHPAQHCPGTVMPAVLHCHRGCNAWASSSRSHSSSSCVPVLRRRCTASPALSCKATVQPAAGALRRSSCTAWHAEIANLAML